jgi:endogenous inhibitor of DNA gyrase (YacG/DUF329 family)
MTIQTKDIFCPTCKKPNTWKPENSFRPFCSDRCKLIDLGAWADEEHKIAGEDVPHPNESSENQE